MPEATLLSTRTVYTGRIFTVTVDRVRLPHGVEHDMELVRHRGSVVLLPIPKPGSLILVKQYRYAAEGFIYEVPAGKLDDGEDPAVCAARELREETGCTAERLERLTTIYTTPGFTDERIHLFMATGLTHGDVAHEKDEFMSIETVPLSRALAMIRDGEITDAKSVVAILFAAGFRSGA